MGKWDKLRDKYPRAPIEGGYAEKLDAVLDADAPARVLGPSEEDLGLKVRHLSDFQLAKLYEDARLEKDRLAAASKVNELEVAAYTREFCRRFEEAGEVSKEFEGGMSIGTTVEPYPMVKDQGALLGWVKAQGLEPLLTLNYQTLAALVKERLEGKVKEPLPDGVDVFMKDKLTCRGRRKEGTNVEEEQ